MKNYRITYGRDTEEYPEVRVWPIEQIALWRAKATEAFKVEGFIFVVDGNGPNTHITSLGDLLNRITIDEPKGTEFVPPKAYYQYDFIRTPHSRDSLRYIPVTEEHVIEALVAVKTELKLDPVVTDAEREDIRWLIVEAMKPQFYREPKLGTVPLVHVTYDDNWADEIDGEADVIWSTVTLAKWLAEAKLSDSNPKYPGLSVSFGSNEIKDYDSFDEFIEAVGYSEIDLAEAKILEKHGTCEGGYCLDHDYFDSGCHRMVTEAEILAALAEIKRNIGGGITEAELAHVRTINVAKPGAA